MRFPAPALLVATLLAVPGCTSHHGNPPQVASAPPPAPAIVPPPAPAPTLLEHLQALAPEADARMLDAALQARACAVGHGQADADARLAVIDYARPSTEPRLWVFDMAEAAPRLLYREHVAHGRGSGENLAQRFSNVEGSLQTSLGLFRTAETYVGGNGYSMRMDGLDAGLNDRARERLIVMHGAWYVDPDQAQRQGRLGRSEGCPAVRDAIARPLIDDLKQGHLLFAWHSDARWLPDGRYLNCGTTDAMAGTAKAPGIHAAPN
ncbi:MAG: murein L,D-transpeptidase catalytic domain family protein [Pseudoxanthomonas suwonensis]|nr:murein L,D-transpeptidase catalytic domain family protein [Pseudoxanthomonas suwonensis]